MRLSRLVAGINRFFALEWSVPLNSLLLHACRSATGLCVTFCRRPSSDGAFPTLGVWLDSSSVTETSTPARPRSLARWTSQGSMKLSRACEASRCLR